MKQTFFLIPRLVSTSWPTGTPGILDLFFGFPDFILAIRPSLHHSKKASLRIMRLWLKNQRREAQSGRARQEKCVGWLTSSHAGGCFFEIDLQDMTAGRKVEGLFGWHISGFSEG